MIKFLLPLVLVALGWLLGLLWQSGLWPNPLLHLYADLRSLFGIAGTLGGFGWGLGTAFPFV